MPKSPGIVDEDGVSSETAIEKLNSEKRFSLCSQKLTFVGKESGRMLLRVAGLFLLQRFCKKKETFVKSSHSKTISAWLKNMAGVPPGGWNSQILVK